MRRTTKQWKQIIADFNQSGLSGEEYRKLHNLPSSSFYKNRAKYRARNSYDETDNDSVGDRQSNFFELKALPSTPIAPEPSIRIRRNDGMVVEVFL